MSVMDDMLAWLTATLDLVEERALDAIDYQSGRWEHGDDGNVYVVRDTAGFTAATDPYRCPEHPEGIPNMCDHSIAADCDHDMGPGDGEARARHVALHDPRAVLARVAAERAVLAEIASSTAQYPDFDGGTVNGLEDAAMLIAWGHRHDAPGFLEHWAPSTVEVTT